MRGDYTLLGYSTGRGDMIGVLRVRTELPVSLWFSPSVHALNTNVGFCAGLQELTLGVGLELVDHGVVDLAAKQEWTPRLEEGLNRKVRWKCDVVLTLLTHQDIVPHHCARSVVASGLFIIPALPGACREPVLVIYDILEVRMC